MHRHYKSKHTASAAASTPSSSNSSTGTGGGSAASTSKSSGGGGGLLHAIASVFADDNEYVYCTDAACGKKCVVTANYRCVCG
jgi:hypothetical protein